MFDLYGIMLMVSSGSSSFITWPVATSESLVVKHSFYMFLRARKYWYTFSISQQAGSDGEDS